MGIGPIAIPIRQYSLFKFFFDNILYFKFLTNALLIVAAFPQATARQYIS